LGKSLETLAEERKSGYWTLPAAISWCSATLRLRPNIVKRSCVEQHHLNMTVREYGEVCLASTDGVQRKKLHNIFNFPSCEKIKVMASSNIPSRKDAHTWEKVFTSRCNGEIDL
jgi:hypothetical protein